MTRTFVVHYSEVALKGRNRPEFTQALRRNVAKSLSGMDARVASREGRIFVETEAQPDEVTARLSGVFGVAWFAEALVVRSDYPEILEAALSVVRSSPGSTFGIAPRRSDKTFGMSSHQLAVSLGTDISALTGKKVDLSEPEGAIHVDVIGPRTLVYSKRARGLGGLPVGTAGRVMHLFSGGIDSPVAAWMLMKRGCRVVYLHFYLAPTPAAAVDSKITRIVKHLAAFEGRATLVLVPFTVYQLATMSAPGDLEPSLFRRFMRMTAEEIAPRFGASAISTGDSLSQAASQTIWNMGAFDEGCTLPILRPLLSYDKDEIVGLARRIGTYEPSLENYRDCCAIVTRHPKTRVKAATISELAQRLRFWDLVHESLHQATIVSYDHASGRTRVSPLADTIPPSGAGPDEHLGDSEITRTSQAKL